MLKCVRFENTIYLFYAVNSDNNSQKYKEKITKNNTTSAECITYVILVT